MGDLLQKGARVELHGLVSAASLNGMSAEIVGKKENGRLMVVVLPARERSVAVRPENVQLLPGQLLQLSDELLRQIAYFLDDVALRRVANASKVMAGLLPSLLERQTHGEKSISQEMTRAAEESMARASIDDQD